MIADTPEEIEKWADVEMHVISVLGEPFLRLREPNAQSWSGYDEWMRPLKDVIRAKGLAGVGLFDDFTRDGVKLNDWLGDLSKTYVESQMDRIVAVIQAVLDGTRIEVDESDNGDPKGLV